MFGVVKEWFDHSAHRVFGLICLACIALLAFGMYLQHVGGLVPCPMCIVQRYALIVVAFIAGLSALSRKRSVHLTGGILVLACAGFGAFVAARQSWLQWYPPEVATCGRDLYGMIENFPLQRAIPMIFKGGGDCTVIDWTFLGGSIANWSFFCFLGIATASVLLIWRSGNSAAHARLLAVRSAPSALASK